MPILTSALAERRLGEIARYYARAGARARVLREMAEAVRRLARHPELGAREATTAFAEARGYRYVVAADRYRVVYLATTSAVTLVTVLDARRDPEILRGDLGG